MSVAGLSCYGDGFRLAGPPSECSLRSKARIDALFEDCRSICSSTLGGWYAGVSTVTSIQCEDQSFEEQKRVNSAVQARIEAMFASVEAESGTPGECAAAILPVKYMGAAPVGGRVASIRGLQEPLRQLLERIDGSIQAELEVSRRGLSFRTSETCEKNNPFRRIAVWSALRLRCRKIPSGESHYAFLPLVGDPDQGQGADDKHADLYRTMRGLKSDVDVYPPIFAVVMRRAGAARLLECHAFACQTEEDAVAAAATLYRALLADLDGNRRRPRHANGLGCVSLASVVSSVREASPSNKSNLLTSPPPKPNVPPHPVRPPRSKKNSISNSATEDEGNKSVGVQKAPRRKKKTTSDVQAEDILEARGRRREPVKPDKPVSLIQKNLEQFEKKDDDNKNSKNIQHAEKIEIDRPTSRTDKIYDDKTNSSIYGVQSNIYEKVLLSRRSNDFDTNSRSIYLPARKDEAVLSSEKNYGSYDFSRRNFDIGSTKESYSKKSDCFPIYDRIDKPSNAKNPIYMQSAKKNDRQKIYEEHFRDAEKIYSLGQEDIYVPGNKKMDRGHVHSSQEDVFFSRNRKNDVYEDVCKKVLQEKHCSRNRERNSSSGTKLCRVVTMDKPLKKTGSNDLEVEPKIPEYSQPRVRRRSRAGSEPPVSRSESTKKIVQETRLKRSQSDLDVERGDLMTRVELPRRASFLKPGSTRRANNMKGGTPLGFTELFDEFRNQEGLTSVDDILAAIIDPEGMSFNDLKPLYKEFLLKLAATLTQDELYQRSASIMRRRRRPQRRRSTRRPCLLGRAIKRSVSRLKGGPTEFTSVIFPARRLNDSFGSSSSCDARNNHRNRVLANRHGKRRSSWRMSKHGQCHTTSEDSDTCRRASRNAGAAANRSSSGYVSCSECSYDSESCTCISADKCYCSLSRRQLVEPIVPNTIVCACDTDSCSESNKCYCGRTPVRSNILEQLRQKGIVPSESTLSRGGSPDRITSSKTSRSHSSSHNSELLKIQSSPVCGSSDNLALDYDLFSPGRKSQQSSDSEKVLVVSARDTQGRLVYVGGAEREKKCFSHGNVRSDAHHEALSIKKSAEIAAVFGSDSNKICRRASNASSIKSSISLEAGLGYLP
ncbi:uncharacterized protein LOC122633770 isoform X1 [Vespula pensylvanica]|uniref:PID domain-containing protein n=1 Tax=Vespula pensylvanica TaxID=30213 RepID=A0A834KTA9_VESPE|nr:uncharacterized protein LOC122633770 isoform X1 [Vespula pensylvanica]XP_043678039.1 uncharacterized protein LOC122633770 isoform X1 [Vespula pensylvanica]KAF7410879.1 hypothetical protein H0235_013486 [Vespula pensylvanica]